MLKGFNVKVIIRVLLLTANIALLTTIFGTEALFFNQVILALILILQVGEFIYFVNHTNRELTRLFLAIRHSDFSLSFRDNKLGRSFKELNDSFNDIIGAYKRVKIEKEVQYQFLQKLIGQINVGIISLHGDNIELINSTAERLLDLQGVKNWNVVKQLNPALAAELDEVGDQGRKLLEVKSGGDSRLISTDISTITVLEQSYRLITLQDINAEIEQKEIEAWHKLIRILTHEIMNSVTPVTSLTETMYGMLSDRNDQPRSIQEISNETISDIRFSLSTIRKRSESLLTFVENYRKLSRIPRPVIQEFEIEPFLNHISTLFSRELKDESITLKVSVSGVHSLKGDPGLIEQVLINLITNSIYALEGRIDKKIFVAAYPEDAHTVIEVTDNGHGMEPREIKEIFVPFFSTKKNGSGIGLSLSKQIMSSHGGRISVISHPETGTSFYLYFRNKG